MQKGVRRLDKRGRSFATFGYIAISVFALAMFVAILSSYDSSLQLSPENEVQNVEYSQLEDILFEGSFTPSGLGIVIIKTGELKEGQFIMTAQQVFDSTMPSGYDIIKATLDNYYTSDQTFQVTINFNTPFQNTYQVSSTSTTDTETTPEGKECWVECSCQKCAYAQYTCKTDGAISTIGPMFVDSCKTCSPDPALKKKFYYDCNPSNEPQCNSDAAVAAWCDGATKNENPQPPASGDGSQCKKDSEAACNGKISGPKTYIDKVPEYTGSGRGR